jgi:hypothetical protein
MIPEISLVTFLIAPKIDVGIVTNNNPITLS